VSASQCHKLAGYCGLCEGSHAGGWAPAAREAIGQLAAMRRALAALTEVSPCLRLAVRPERVP
jgi:hypothetical protein